LTSETGLKSKQVTYIDLRNRP